MLSFSTRAFLAAALCVSSALPAATTPGVPLRIDCGGSGSGKPGAADYWQPDKPFVVDGDKYTFEGKISTQGVSDPAPDKIYQTVRRDNPEWHFKSIPDGIYLVRLHFADANEKTDRRMNFWFQGVKLIENFSVNKAAGGSFRAFVVEVIVQVTAGGGLKVRGSKGAGDDCYVAGMEILPAPANAQLTPALEDDTRRPRDLGARIRKLTGGATRLVWTRLGDQHDIFSEKRNSRLFGLDTEDGGAEHCILAKPGSYARPMVTPDGRVVFSDVPARRCYIVNFDGSNLRELAPGFAACLWTDPETGGTWVCVREKESGSSTHVMMRRKLDKPEQAEKIWTTSDDESNAISHFNLMPDGLHAVDCNPWPNVGAIDLARGRFHMEANGCWPSVAPDGSGRFFIFRGNHRAVWMFDSLRAGGRKVSIDTVPDAPLPTVYHPRWTNHPQFITVTSPLGHRESKLYIGKWSPDFSGIEAWQRITWSDSPEAFGNAWIAGATAKSATPPKLIAPSQEEPSPAHKRGLVFVWKNQRAENAIIDERGKAIRLCRATMHGHTRPSFTQGADIRDGSLDADDDSAKALAPACAKSGAMSISFVTETSDPSRDGIILCYGNPGSPAQITIEASNGKLHARLGTSPVAGTISPGDLVPGRPQHWAVTFDAGLQSLQPALLRFGRDADGNGSWRGSIEKIEIYDRSLSAAEIGQLRTDLAKELAQREPPPRIVVEAELLQATRTEEPENIRPYRRSLSENLYRVRNVISGGLKAEKFIALQWSILDSQKLKTDRKPGDVVTLKLEPEEAHAELGGEHRSSDLIAPDLPLLYDIDS